MCGRLSKPDSEGGRRRERDTARMCLDAPPRGLSPSPPFLKSRALCSGERPRFWSTAPVLRGRPPGARHTERLSDPSASPHRALLHLPGPQQHPTAEREPRESEGESEERGAEKGAGIGVCVCRGEGGGRITCEWLEKNNRGRAWSVEGGKRKLSYKTQQKSLLSTSGQ